MMNLMGVPSLPPMVKRLLLINVIVFVIQMIFPIRGDIPFDEQKITLDYWFSAIGIPWTMAIQVWRLITFQFLHGSFFHILLNMWGLYMFGVRLEPIWGSKKFLTFYLTCGFVGGLVYVVGCQTGYFGGYLIGASGGVLGLLMASAILFPQMKIFLFPIPIAIPIRILTLVAVMGYVLNVVRNYNAFGSNAGGDLCHLGGMATAFIWLKWGDLLRFKFKFNLKEGSYQRKLERDQKMQFEVDRILAKVSEQGIQSLSRKEKQILQKATEKKKKTG
ncbi:MAG: rhomboid family intramembrane serine protease [Sedimentisphaerales bacterium]|nr:rhomboid family intramembrane serine protease [Sedimentisphaerales bacterium]